MYLITYTRSQASTIGLEWNMVYVFFYNVNFKKNYSKTPTLVFMYYIVPSTSRYFFHLWNIQEHLVWWVCLKNVR